MKSILTLIFLLALTIPAYPDTNQDMQLNKLNKNALKLFSSNDLDGGIGVWNEATKILEQINNQSSLSAEIFNNLGYAYYLKNNYSKAEEWLLVAQQIDPKRWSVYLNLGDLYYKLDVREKYVENYKSVLALKTEYKYKEKLNRRINCHDRSTLEYTSTIQVHHSLLPFTLKYFVDQDEREYFILVSDSTGKQIAHIELFTGYALEEDSFEVKDFNGDGYADLRYLESAGGTGNKNYGIKIYEPNNSTYREPENDEIPSFLYSEFDKNPNGEVTTFWKMGCAGLCYETSTYSYINGKYTISRETSQEMDIKKGKSMFHFVARERNGDVMVIKEDIWEEEGDIRF